MEIAGITRKREFSPNHVLNDLLIIQETAETLNRLGAKVSIYSEDDLATVEIKEDYIFSMVQSPKGSERLFEIAKNKKLVINTPQSVINCYRYNLLRILKDNKINIPESIVIPADTKDFGILDKFSNEVWVKRGDAHAVRAEDVVFLDDKKKLGEAIQEFRNRGIEQCAVQNHIEGDTVKFYSVLNTNLFHFYGTELKYNNKFDLEELKQLANQSAVSLGLEIFGGDAIITNDSEIYIIDINDWPSFAPIRKIAGKVIGNFIFKKVSRILETTLCTQE